MYVNVNQKEGHFSQSMKIIGTKHPGFNTIIASATLICNNILIHRNESQDSQVGVSIYAWWVWPVTLEAR